MRMNVNDFETKENNIISWIKRSGRETLAKWLVGESTGNRRHHRKNRFNTTAAAELEGNFAES